MTADELRQASGEMRRLALADKWADYQDRARDAVSAPEALRGIPDPTWDRPFSERDRLREIPLQRGAVD